MSSTVNSLFSVDGDLGPTATGKWVTKRPSQLDVS
jgi:hypothetical protein